MMNKISRRQFLTTTGSIPGAAIIDPMLTVKAAPRPTHTEAKPVASKLKFNDNGEFKILQLTDVHHVDGNPRSSLALRNIVAMMRIERPDFVILTGDTLKGSDKNCESYQAVADQLDTYGVPFVILFGNHEPGSSGLTLGQLYDMTLTKKNNIQPDRGSIDSPDYTLLIRSHDGTKDAPSRHSDGLRTLLGRQYGTKPFASRHTRHRTERKSTCVQQLHPRAAWRHDAGLYLPRHLHQRRLAPASRQRSLLVEAANP